MDLHVVYSKTAKGLRTANAWFSGLSSQTKRVLSLLDGKLSAGEILAQSEGLTEDDLEQVLSKLESDGHIRLLLTRAAADDWTHSSSASSMGVEVIHHAEAEEIDAETLDFTNFTPESKTDNQAKEAAEQKERQEAEARAKAEAARKVREDAERRGREEAAAIAKLDAEEKARLEAERIAREKAKAEEDARLQAEAEARAKAEAERKAKAEAEEKARLAAERIAREEAERKAKAEAEARLKAEAEARARAEAEKKAREETERREREAAEVRARAEAEEKARIEAERLAREEAERKARAEEEARLKAEAEARAKAEEEARLETERKAREEAEARARAKVEEEAQLEAERRAKAEAEEKARLEAERIAREEAERKARAEEEARLKAEAEARAKAEEEARRAAERKAREEAEARARAAAEEKARKEAERIAKEEAEARAKLKAKGKALAMESRGAASTGKGASAAIMTALIYALLAVLLLIGLLHVVNLGMLVKPIEQLATESIGEPVSVKAVHGSLFPQPHLVIDNVTIGGDAGMTIAAVNVQPDTATLFKDVKMLKSLEIEGLKVEQENFGRPLQWISESAKAEHLKIDQINLKKISLKLRDLELGPFDGKIGFTESHALKNIELNSADRSLAIQITPQGGSSVVTLTGSNWHLPANPQMVFDEINAKGTVHQNRIDFSQIEGTLYGGSFKAKAVVDYSNRWVVAGNFALSNATLPLMLTAFGSSASIEGSLNLTSNFASKADEATKLGDNPDVSANFELRDGKINGVDLVRAVLAGGNQPLAGDATKFDKLSGSLQFKGGRYQYMQLTLDSAQFHARGNLDITQTQDIAGKISAELATPSRKLQASIGLGGKVGDVKRQ